MNSTPQPLGWYCGEVTVQRGAPPMLSLWPPTLISFDTRIGMDDGGPAAGVQVAGVVGGCGKSPGFLGRVGDEGLRIGLADVSAIAAACDRPHVVAQKPEVGAAFVQQHDCRRPRPNLRVLSAP